MATKTIGQLTQATTIDNLDEFAIQSGGITKRIAASVVRGEIVNANIKSDAAIALTKLAALDSAEIVVGNGSNVPTAVAVTGDVTISNAGVTAIGSAKVLPAMLSQPFTLDTAKASTSGTSIDFTGIPSWAKRVTVMFNEVSLSGNSSVLVQIGSGSVQTTPYLSGSHGTNNSGVTTTFGYAIVVGGAGNGIVGAMQLHAITGNGWISNHAAYLVGTLVSVTGGGSSGLPGALDRVRITTVNGTDTFAAGSISISYEG